MNKVSHKHFHFSLIVLCSVNMPGSTFKKLNINFDDMRSLNFLSKSFFDFKSRNQICQFWHVSFTIFLKISSLSIFQQCDLFTRRFIFGKNDEDIECARKFSKIPSSICQQLQLSFKVYIATKYSLKTLFSKLTKLEHFTNSKSLTF